MYRDSGEIGHATVWGNRAGEGRGGRSPIPDAEIGKKAQRGNSKVGVK